MSKSSIQWTDETANWIVGCTKTRAKGAKESGCDLCYAATAANSARLQQFPQYQTVVDGKGNWNGNIEFVPKVLDDLLKGNRKRRVFTPSMSDPFHPNVKQEWLDQFIATVALTPHITYQCLTKRPERMHEYFSEYMTRRNIERRANEIATEKRLRKTNADGVRLVKFSYECMDWPLPNLHLGVSVENQAAADERIPWLLKTPAAVRFLSVEPLLEDINLTEFLGNGICQTQRRDHLSTGSEWGIDNRRSRMHLEDRQKRMGQMESMCKAEQMQECQGGNDYTTVSSYKRNVQPEDASNGSAQVGVSAFLRADSSRNDDQSQGWEQEEQSSIQPRNRDIIGTDESCFQNRSENPVWAEEPCQQIDRLGHGKNKGDVCNRQFNTEANCGDLWSGASNSLKNSKGGSSGNVGGGDSRLYPQKESREEKARYDGQILFCIIGGESGKGARPFNLDWARSLHNQCKEAGIKFFMKQAGSNVWDGDRQLKLRDRKGGDLMELPEDLRIREIL
jgi:protein gp37